MFGNYFKTISLILLAVLLLGCKNSDPPSIIDPPVEPPVDTLKTTENKMYVYSNSGNTFYLVDYKTFEVVREIQLPVSDTVYYEGMKISTNRDYLFFGADGQYPNPLSGFALYNIKKEKSENLYFTNFRYGTRYFIAAENETEPGLIYAHFRDYGTYSIDVLQHNVKEFINDEHAFTLDKRIFHTNDNNWTIVKKNWEGSGKGYTELEFYTKNSGLHDLKFILNKNNKDSLRIYDWTLLKNNKLFITYLPGPKRESQAQSGYYDLETGKLYKTNLMFPWSLSGYYLASSAARNEIYQIGSDGRFYIIDSDNYSIKDTVILSNKGEQSPILITPDNNFAFEACPSSNLIFVIDLNSREVIKTITVNEPYNMVIP